MSRLPNPPGKERRSRRLHTNSKDGCPNCKAGRIKCTEELPVCHNCRVRDSRCGYLDFPPDRLEHIRLKNERKEAALLAANTSPLSAGHLSTTPDSSVSNGALGVDVLTGGPRPDTTLGGYGPQGMPLHPMPYRNGEPHLGLPHPVVYYPPVGFIAEDTAHRPIVPHVPGLTPYAVHPLDQPFPHLPDQVRFGSAQAEPPAPVPVHLAMSPNAPLDTIPHTESPMEGYASNLSIEPQLFGEKRSDIYQHPSGYPETALLFRRDSTSSRKDVKRIRIRNSTDQSRKNSLAPLPQSFRTVMYSQNVPGADLSEPSWAALLDMWATLLDGASEIATWRKASTTDCSPDISTLGSVSLPNCINKPTRFPRQRLPDHLRCQPLRDCIIQGRKNKNFLYAFPDSTMEPRPVWLEDQVRKYLLKIFQRATMFHVFFSYFIDKSINLLIRASAAVVNGDIVYSPSASSDHLSEPHNKFGFFYNPADLEALTLLSYKIYGRFLQDLRKSLSTYSPEYLARMSLISAWSCFLHPLSDVNTYCLLLRGAIIILKQVVGDLQSQVWRDLRVKSDLSGLHTFALQSVCPDYNFDIIKDIHQSFEKYKVIVDEFLHLQDEGKPLDEDLVEVLSDPLFRHDYHELELFLRRLQEHYYPMVQTCNEHFCRKKGFVDTGDIHFVSPSLIFDLTYEWFRVYRGDKMLVGYRSNPLKQVLYNFFHALAKCLAHVLTPIKLVLYADACNVVCTKVGMEFRKPLHLDEEQYQALTPIVQSLLKTIRFFESRLRLYGYYMVSKSVLDDIYIQRVQTAAPETWRYRDVVHILPSKISVRERQVDQFSAGIIAAHNYAIFDELRNDPAVEELIHVETDRQHAAMQTEPYVFDYRQGMSNHDFNPQLVIEHLMRERTARYAYTVEVGVDVVTRRIDNLLHSRDEIAAVIQASQPQTEGGPPDRSGPD